MGTKEAKYDFIGEYQQGVAIVVKNGKYGAILQGGHEIIDPSYDYISPFKEGYADAIKNGIYFVLNLSGNMCVKDGSDYIEIPNKYQQARDFKDGLCCVCHDEKWGAIDKNGHEVIPTQYDYLSDFTKGIAIYRISSRDNIEHKYLFGFLNKSGAVFPAIYDSIWVDDTTGYIHTEYIERLIEDDEKRIYNHPKRLDSNGSLVAKNGLKYIALKNKYDYVEDFINGLSLVRKNGLWGAIDVYEHIVVPVKYNLLYAFKTNVTIGCIEDKYEKEFKADFIQTDGKVIGHVEHIYKIAPIDGNVSVFCINKKVGWNSKKQYGIINKSGIVLLEAEFEKVRKERTGLYRIEANLKNGLFDIDKGWIIPCKFDDISIKDNMFVVQIKQLGSFNFNLLGKCFVLNNGKCVELPDFCFVGRDFVNGYAPVAIGDKWGIIDTNNEIVLEALYDDIDNLCDDVFRVSQKEGGNWKHGIYRIGKGEILSVDYKNVEKLTSSLFIFGEESEYDWKFSEYGVIDKKGKIILPQNYYSIKVNGSFFFIKENSFQRETTSNSLLANLEGKTIVKSQYTFVNVIKQDWVITNNNSLLGFVNLHTMKEYAPSFDEIEDFEDDILRARKDGHFFFLNKDAQKVVKIAGEWIVIPNDIYWIGEFHDGKAAVLVDKDSSKDAYIDMCFNVIPKVSPQVVGSSKHVSLDNEPKGLGHKVVKQGDKKVLKSSDQLLTGKGNEKVVIKKNILEFDVDDYFSRIIYITLPKQYEGGDEFVGNYAKVIKNGKYGIVYCYFPEKIDPPSDSFEYEKYMKDFCENRKFEEIIPPIYDSIDITKDNSQRVELRYDFNNRYDYEQEETFSVFTFICVKKNHKYLINTDGCVICELIEAPKEKLEVLSTEDKPFTKWAKEGAFNGLSIVQSKENGKFGCLDEFNTFIIPMNYQRMDFSNRFIVASDDVFSFVFDDLGNIIFKMKAYGLEVLDRNIYIAGHKIVIVKQGEPIEIDTKYGIQFKDCIRENNYLKICIIGDKVDNRYGIVNLQGQVLLPFEFHNIGAFIDGFSIVRKNKFYGVVDHHYTMIIPCYYESITYDKQAGIFLTNVGCMTKYGEHVVFINDGNLLLNSKYRRIDEFINGVAIVDMVIDKKLKYGLVNTQGEEILPPIYSFMKRLSNGMFKCCLNGRVGVLSKHGRYIIPNQFLFVGEYENGLSLVATSVDGTYTKESLREYGYMDLEGNVVLSACSYISKQLDGISVICRYGKWGFYAIEQLTTTLVKGVSFLGLLHNDLAKVNFGGTFTNNKVIGGKWGFVNRNGEIVINPEYDYVFNFSEGIAAVKVGDKYGFIDTTGVLIVPCEYDEVESSFEDGEGKLVKGDKVYVFNRSGEMVSEHYKKNNEENEYDYGADNPPSIYDNPYYNDNLDMDQQSIEFWNSL